MRPITILWIFSAAKNFNYRSSWQQLRAKIQRATAPKKKKFPVHRQAEAHILNTK
jgi:hypothetical protein